MPSLTWLTRGADVKVAAAAPYRLLEAVPALDDGNNCNSNLFITRNTGDHHDY